MKRMITAVVAYAVVAAGCGATSATAGAEPSAAGKKCHSSYKGRCLKRSASDYDCAGGSGNGPYYTGRVRVVGPDVFRLDTDGDGLGCE